MLIREDVVALGRRGGSWEGVVAQREGVVAQLGRRGGSMVAHQTVVLQSQVRIRHLPSPQQTANLLEGCHLGCTWLRADLCEGRQRRKL
jgi:hypothetical protein